jgi:hypothetical protein
MAWIALDSIKRALRLCGAYSAGEAPTAAVGQICLEALNAMRAQWTTRGLICYGSSILSVSANGSETYQFGTGGDNPTRPQQPFAATFETSSHDVQTLDLIAWEEYQKIYDKGQTGTPTYWAWNGQFPTASLALWPVPSSGTIRVLIRSPFADIASLSSVIADPPEYREAMEYGLALRIAPEIMGTDVPATVAELAASSYKNILRRNVALSIPKLGMPAIYGYTHDGEEFR